MNLAETPGVTLILRDLCVRVRDCVRVRLISGYFINLIVGVNVFKNWTIQVTINIENIYIPTDAVKSVI